LDASAFLAYLQGETGSPLVTQALSRLAWMSTVNWAEALSKLAMQGFSPEAVRMRLETQHILDDMLVLYDFDAGLAEEVARLRPLTKSLGLSTGDRACLALASRHDLPVLTTDRAWSALQLGITIRVIR
jgi:PIN domain nuclease of toxin-antitoxin system